MRRSSKYRKMSTTNKPMLFMFTGLWQRCLKCLQNYAYRKCYKSYCRQNKFLKYPLSRFINFLLLSFDWLCYYRNKDRHYITLFFHNSVLLLVPQRNVLTTLVVVRDFLGILFLAGDFIAGAQTCIIMNIEEQFSVINVYGWRGDGMFTTENVIIMYLPIVSDIMLGENSFIVTLRFFVFLIWNKNWDLIPPDC